MFFIVCATKKLINTKLICMSYPDKLIHFVWITFKTVIIKKLTVTSQIV